MKIKLSKPKGKTKKMANSVCISDGIYSVYFQLAS